MERRAVSGIVLALLLIGMLTLTFKIELPAAIVPKSPAIYVDPPVVEGIMPCNNVTVSIKTDYSGYDILAWQFTLSYNPSILHGVEVRNGDLITTEKVPTARFIPGTFDNALGTLSLTGAFFFYIISPPPTTYGPGTLAYVTFHVVGYGFSNITLGPETKLIGWEPLRTYDIVNAETMPDHIGHGYFSNILLGDADFNGLVEMPDFYYGENSSACLSGRKMWTPTSTMTGTWTCTTSTYGEKTSGPPFPNNR